MMKILIMGADGQLGHALQACLAPLGTVTALNRQQLDLRDADALRAALGTLQPEVLCNAAAYTAVERAETEQTAAFDVNAQAPAIMAQHCARHGTLLLHYSTDYVFDGRKTTPYLESDPIAPLNVYGASKAAGEAAIVASPAAAVVLRTSWVFGDHGQNFARTMFRLACERDALRIVGDQHGAPTWAGRLAEVSRLIIEQAAASGAPHDWLHVRRGIYHACAAGATTWADYARTVIASAAQIPQLAARLKVQAQAIEAIPSSAYPTPAARPTNSRLDCSHLRATFGYAFPDWQGDVQSFVQRVLAPHAATDSVPN